MAVAERLRLRADASVELAPDGMVTLAEGHMRMPVGRLGRGLRAAMTALSQDGAVEAELHAGVVAAEGEAALFKLHLLMRRLQDAGWVQRTLHGELGPVATLEPTGHVTVRTVPPPRPDEPLVLSRFAVLRTEPGVGLLWESPRSDRRVVLHDPAQAGAMAAWHEPGTLADLPGDLERGVARLLVDAAVVVRPEEEQTVALERWSAHDLLFHARTRAGRHLGGFGGSYRLEGRQEPLPAVRPPFAPAIALPPLDLAASAAADPPLTQVIEQRQSRREHDDEHPITLAQLGELLGRSARLRRTMHDGHEELASRPYPSGGSLYELELYPLIHRVDGLEPGLYHYDSDAHALGRVAEVTPDVKLLQEYGRVTSTMPTPPQVLLTVSARVGRVMWKYESMAYALILKHVGVLYQTLYLTGEAMGLAVCGLGGGNPDAFAAASGIDYYEETSVGELVLGSRRGAPAR